MRSSDVKSTQQIFFANAVTPLAFLIFFSNLRRATAQNNKERTFINKYKAVSANFTLPRSK